jgi:hypothetical protein
MAGVANGIRPGVRWPRALGVVAVLAGAALVAGLAGGAGRSAGDEPKAADAALPPDLARVPDDAVAFVTVRLGELWNQEAARAPREQLVKEYPAALEEWRGFVGLPPGDVERLTAVLVDIAGGGQPFPLFYVETAQPIDRAKILANVAPGAKEEKRKGHTLYTGPRGNAVHFLGDRAYTVASAETIRELLERPAPTKEGPLAAALKLAAGKHAVVAALNPTPVVQQVGDNLPPQGEVFRPLLKTQLATLVIDLDGGVRGDLRLDFAGEKDARQAKEAVQTGLDLARAGLSRMVKDMTKDASGLAKFGDLLKQAETDLKDVGVRQEGARLEVAGQVKTELAPAAVALAEALVKVRQGAARAQSTNNLKQIALAMHNYHDTNRHFPPQAIYSPDGKPLLSWRVLILPYLAQDDLYKEFRLDEPWDSEHNKKLLAKMPKTYAMPGEDKKEPTETYYQGFAGKGAFFDGKQGTKIQDITDGTSNTILVVEAAKAVPWTKPADLPFDPEKPLPKLGGHFGNVFNAAFCDGSVHAVSRNVKEETLKALITIGGGEVIPADFNK